jgi:uncharacterized protein YciI
MKQWIYKLQLLRPELLSEGPNAMEAAALSRHVAYLREAQAEGLLLLAGRTQSEDPAGYGIVIFLASDEATAERFMQKDPAVAEGVMRAGLHPYTIAFADAARIARVTEEQNQG